MKVQVTIPGLIAIVFAQLIVANISLGQCYDHQNGQMIINEDCPNGDILGTDQGYCWKKTSFESGQLDVWVQYKTFTDPRVFISIEKWIEFNDVASENGNCSSPTICLQGSTCNWLATEVMANDGVPSNEVTGLAIARTNGYIKETSTNTTLNDGNATGWANFWTKHWNDPNNLSQWLKRIRNTGGGQFCSNKEMDTGEVETNDLHVENEDNCALHFECTDSMSGLSNPEVVSRRKVRGISDNTGYDLTWSFIQVVVCSELHEDICQINSDPDCDSSDGCGS